MDEENSRRLAGLVSGAVWSDLGGDGYPELILASEWGPVRIFRNERGKLVSWDAPVTLNHQRSTLNQLTGWWNAVTTGDIDGDGKLDIIASNWGLNSSYQPSPEHPIYLYYGDFAERGTVDLIEAEFDPLGKCIAPRRMRAAVSMALPDLPERFPTHKEFSEACIENVLGPQRSKAHELQVNTLASMLFLNRGDHFDAVPLPPEAQFAPAFSVNVADFDGDGREDVFLSQNFFATQPETPRLDAGRGLLLLGDGTGRLRAAPGEESGIKVYGEQRGAAFCDYDEDGRIDLVVTQNGAETRLYHNAGAKPGLRIRLKGPPGNPTGAGAQMRLQSGSWKGPVREVHAGSGYWSQDSAVQVLGSPEPPTGIWVGWPGGQVTTSAVPEKAREICIDLSGKLELIRTSER